ncbi:hypothetical protein [Ralstonia solanacearum]|uniref:hypothetical protein n=1 Tax=Ralstonia solanacearum TaxID=305 RepID=UPI00142FB6F8|nr:hypothetical protein [Ralstonia solanacearum]
MIQEQKVIRAKVGMLELAKQLGNVRLPSCAFRSIWLSLALERTQSRATQH